MQASALAFIRALLAYWACVVLQLVRSLLHHVLHRRTWLRSRSEANYPAPVPGIDCPVVLIPGNMGDARAAAVHWSQQLGVRVLSPAIGPVSSCHDRACELFYALKGGAVDYGAAHSSAHGHRRFGRQRPPLMHDWSAAVPLLLVTHSQGANTARALQELLAVQAFEGHDTSAEWVRGIVCIAAPFDGVSVLHTLGVPPPAPAGSHCSRRATGLSAPPPPLADLNQLSTPGAARIEQHVGGLWSIVGAAISIGYVLHVLLGWSNWFRQNVWDWRVDQWELRLADVPALLTRTHPLLLTTDTALFELTPEGALAMNRSLRTHERSFYVSLPATITTGGEALPHHRARPQHVVTAALASTAVASYMALRAILAEYFSLEPVGHVSGESRLADGEKGAITAMESESVFQGVHSDGLLPTSTQFYPRAGFSQPHRGMSDLTPPALRVPHASGAGEERAAATVDQLATQLVPGCWCVAQPSLLDHTDCSLIPESPLLQHVIGIILPAICHASAATSTDAEAVTGTTTQPRDNDAERPDPAVPELHAHAQSRPPAAVPRSGLELSARWQVPIAPPPLPVGDTAADESLQHSTRRMCPHTMM